MAVSQFCLSRAGGRGCEDVQESVSGGSPAGQNIARTYFLDLPNVEHADHGRSPGWEVLHMEAAPSARLAFLLHSNQPESARYNDTDGKS